MKKRAKAHLLPTDKAENCIIKHGEALGHIKGSHSQQYLKSHNESSHHLYITTEDEIKEGDWCLFFWDGMKDGELGQVGSEPQQYLPSKGHTLNRNLRKIIATTDPKLHSTRLKDCPVNPEDNMVSVRGVSKHSKEFIEEYCKAGGIDEVDVEYGLFHDGNFKDDDETHAFKATRKPRVTSNNEIIIHSIEEKMYNREEVVQLFRDYQNAKARQILDGGEPLIPLEWIKENLN